MKLPSDFFALFSLPVDWQVDDNQIDIRYRQLQRQFHPDRYANKSHVEQRLAVQTAAMINQAYETLKSPLKRAQYLLELQGLEASQDSYIASDESFLMEQIEWREQLSQVRDSDEPHRVLDNLQTDTQRRYLALQCQFEAQYQLSAYNDGFHTVAKMQFMSKLLDEIEQLESELED